MGKHQQTYRAKLANELRARRGDLGQTAFAKKIGISQSTLNRIENEDQNVTIDMLEIICKRMKCKLSDLIAD
jgi:putative transcriptional regulator